MAQQESPGYLSFDEFRLYYESTERVTDRRLEANRWNYSISLAVLAAIGALSNWAFSRRAFFVVGLAGCALLALMAGLFATLWIKQITDFKALNNAKFAVLNEMAKHVVFPSEQLSGQIRSFCPFEREWEELKAAQAVAPVRGTSVVTLALNSSNSEYYIPKAVRLIFIALFLATIAIGATNWSSVAHSVRCLTSDVGNARCQ